MQIFCEIKKDCPDKKKVKQALIETLKDRLQEWKERYLNKVLAIRCWFRQNELSEMQFMLEQGFMLEGIVAVLKYDLTKEILAYIIPDGIKIGFHDFDSEGMKQYLTANELGYDHVQDSEDELRFRLCGEKTKVFTAMAGNKVVVSTTVWEVEEQHSATHDKRMNEQFVNNRTL